MDQNRFVTDRTGRDCSERCSSSLRDRLRRRSLRSPCRRTQADGVRLLGTLFLVPAGSPAATLPPVAELTSLVLLTLPPNINKSPQKRAFVYGGWGEIRTHELRKESPVFKTGAFNRSATHPRQPQFSDISMQKSRRCFENIFYNKNKMIKCILEPVC